MAKRGRPKKPGERYPGGQLKHIDTIAPTLLHRIREHGAKFGIDAKLSTELGRQLLLERINAAQAAGGFKYGEIAGRAAFYNGGRRYAKSPSYEFGFRGAEGREGSDVFDDIEARRPEVDGRRIYSDYELRAIDAEDKYVDLQFELCKEWTRAQIFALERVCIDDEAPDPILLHLDRNKETVLRRMLNSVVAHFGLTGAPKKNKNNKTSKPVTSLRPQNKTKAPREMDLVLSMIARLRPDLSADHRAVEWHNFCALRERENFRSARNNQIGAL